MTEAKQTEQKWIHCKDFTPTKENFKFGEFKVLKNQSGRIPFKYNNEKLWIETRRHRNPFGLSRGRPEDEENYNKKITCSLSFDMNTKSGKAFHDNMIAFQEVLIDTAYENRVAWQLCKPALAAKTTREMIERMFNPVVRVPQDKDGNIIPMYPPTFRVELYSVKDDATGKVKGVTTEVYDQVGSKLEKIDESTITPGSEAKVIMGAMHIYVIPQSRFGISWRLHQLRIFPGATLPTGKCLLRDDDVEDNDSGEEEMLPTTKPEKPTAAPTPAPPVGQNGGGDGDGSGEENNMPPTPTPVSTSSRPRLSLKK
jgi:hypothetical protein